MLVCICYHCVCIYVFACRYNFSVVCNTYTKISQIMLPTSCIHTQNENGFKTVVHKISYKHKRNNLNNELQRNTNKFI